MSQAPAEIPLLRGAVPGPGDPEHRERQKYESGAAEEEVRSTIGPGPEGWLEVVKRCEPGSLLSLDFVLEHPELSARVRGRVIDLGAGTCWATARLSRHRGVEEVVALDLAAGFLTRIGSGVIRATGGDPGKIRFAESSFERTPFAAGSFDAAFLIAALHHSLAPLKVLLEARRLLAPGGLLVVVENPGSVLGIGRQRRLGLELSRQTGATEIAYTRGEIAYLLAHAGFDRITFHPVGGFSSNPLKRWARRLLRRLGLEHLVLAVGYVIVAEPCKDLGATPERL